MHFLRINILLHIILVVYISALREVVLKLLEVPVDRLEHPPGMLLRVLIGVELYAEGVVVC